MADDEAARRSGARLAVERLDEGLQPRRLHLGVVVEDLQQLAARVAGAEVHAAGESERHVGDDHLAVGASTLLQSRGHARLGRVEDHDDLDLDLARVTHDRRQAAPQALGVARRDDRRPTRAVPRCGWTAACRAVSTIEPVPPLRDIQTVEPSGRRLDRLPHGMVVRELVTHTDERGTICELYDPRWGVTPDEMVFAYQFTIRPGMAKGWGMHREHEDRYAFLDGELELAFYDARESSPTFGEQSRLFLSQLHRTAARDPAGRVARRAQRRAVRRPRGELPDDPLRPRQSRQVPAAAGHRRAAGAARPGLAGLVGVRAPSGGVFKVAGEMTLVPGDPLAHRALESLLRAEASVRRRLSADLEREGLSATGFSLLVILTTAGGELELRVLRARLRTSKANATEVVTTLESRGLVDRRRMAHDRRAATVAITAHGAEIVDRLFPEHSERVAQAFAVLDESEKRSLAQICRKLAA